MPSYMHRTTKGTKCGSYTFNMSFGTKSSYQHKSSATRTDIKWGKKDFSLGKK